MNACVYDLAYTQNIIPVERSIDRVESDSTYYLSIWVIPGSITVRSGGKRISSGYWNFNEVTGYWSLKSDIPDSLISGGSLTLNYDILPLSLSRTYGISSAPKLDRSLLEQTDSLGAVIAENSREGLFNESDLRQSGSLSRGIIVGTNQDFSLESGLNFELTGKLTDNISINASLTDQSIPIQPDGTTQNLREFDQVYIELNAPNAGIRMGDIDVSLQQNTFSKYNRRLQGASGTYNPGDGRYSAAASVVRGNFKTINFQGSDGVQGPYRLTGRNNENFIIVLAGTEKVYINGQQVERGAENDYIIDYGLGEIYFTENILILDETRIFVEYEYIDQDFNRTLIAAEAADSFWGGKLRLGATVIRQADGDELLSQQSLSRSDIEFLETVGDDLDNALVTGATVATEEEQDQFVLYSRVDTTLAGQTFEIFRNQPGSPDNILRVRFSRVPDGDGEYRRVGGTVNGILYEWVGPGNGSYVPFRQLPAPQKQQMVSINTDLKTSDHLEFFGEWAVSDLDQNRFSELDDGDNTDLAYNTGLRLKNIKAGSGTVSAEIKSRYSGRNFAFFERTREVEFARKWNISNISNNQELINEASVSWNPSENWDIAVGGGQIERDRFKGLRQSANINSEQNAFVQVNYLQEFIQSEDDILEQDSDWFRQIGSVSKSLELQEFRIRPYVSFWQEDRRQRNSTTDSLSNISQRFYEIGPGINIQRGGVELDASVVNRKEDGVIDDQFQDQATAIEQRYAVGYNAGNNFSTRNELKIRNKEFTEAFQTLGNQSRRGLFFNSQTRYNTSADHLNGDLTYRVNTQRQSILQETYIEVGPELGQFVWNDINQDGVQQIDEFFPELSPNEGIYVRQFLPSDDLVPVVDLNARAIHRIRPFAGADTWFTGIELLSRVDVRENSRTDALSDIYLLKLNTFRRDSTTLSGRIFWEKEADLFSEVENAELRFGFNQNRTFNQRSSESIRGYNDNYYINSSYRLGRGYSVNMDMSNGRNRSNSDRLGNRNFDIESWIVSPGFSTIINRSLQADLKFSYIDKRDRLPVEEVQARILKWTTSVRAYLWEKIQTNSRAEIRNTAVNGSSSSFGIFELTEGTGEGTNLLWSVNANYRLSNFVRLSFNYDGRTVRNNPGIHTIKLVVSAVF